MKTLKDYEYYKTELGVLYKGDCKEILPLITNNSIDITITSPPYNVSNKRIEKYKEYADNLSIEDYYIFQCACIDNTLSKTKKQFFYNIQMLSGNKQALFKIIGKYYNKIKEVLIWDKINAEPAISKNVLNSAFEFIIVFDNNNADKRYFENAVFDRGTESNILKIKKNYNNITETHSAIMNELVPIHIIKLFTQPNEIIMDIFMGCGTTALACEKLKRRWIGIEISEEYCEVAKNRIEKEARQIKMF